MAAQLIEENELQNSSIDQEEEVTTPAPTEEMVGKSEEVGTQEQADELPEKYRGKSAAEIAKMHMEAEKLIGRQANEVHEIRSLADQLLKQQLESKQTAGKPIEESLEDDFFADPKKAVAKTVEQHPAVQEAQRVALEMKKMQTAQKLAAKHPDFVTIAQDASFQDWVKSSAVRLQLFARADAEYDFESADELLSTYKELKAVKSQKQAEVSKQIDESAKEAAMKAATVDVGGTGEASRKIYRRADLIKLKMTDPERYMALQDEIIQAYAEGRVK